jgi:hypothetical protein
MAVQTRLAALRTFLLPTPKFPGFRLASATAQTSLKRRAKEYLGMLRRVVTRGYLRPEPRN